MLISAIGGTSWCDVYIFKLYLCLGSTMTAYFRATYVLCALSSWQLLRLGKTLRYCAGTEGIPIIHFKSSILCQAKQKGTGRVSNACEIAK